MKHLTLAHIVANYNIKGGKAVQVYEEYKNRLFQQAWDKEDRKAVLDDEARHCYALKLTERYARIYHKEKEYTYLSQEDLKRFKQ